MKLKYFILTTLLSIFLILKTNAQQYQVRSKLSLTLAGDSLKVIAIDPSGNYLDSIDFFGVVSFQTSDEQSIFYDTLNKVYFLVYDKTLNNFIFHTFQGLNSGFQLKTNSHYSIATNPSDEIFFGFFDAAQHLWKVHTHTRPSSSTPQIYTADFVSYSTPDSIYNYKYSVESDDWFESKYAAIDMISYHRVYDNMLVFRNSLNSLGISLFDIITNQWVDTLLNVSQSNFMSLQVTDGVIGLLTEDISPLFTRWMHFVIYDPINRKFKRDSWARANNDWGIRFYDHSIQAYGYGSGTVFNSFSYNYQTQAWNNSGKIKPVCILKLIQKNDSILAIQTAKIFAPGIGTSYDKDYITDSNQDTINMNQFYTKYSGLYSVNLSLYNGVDSSNCNDSIIPILTRLNDAKLNTLSFFPNPAIDIITFNKNLDAILEIYNLSGQLVQKKELSNASSIDVSSIISGVYFINLLDDADKTFNFLFFKK